MEQVGHEFRTRLSDTDEGRRCMVCVTCIRPVCPSTDASHLEGITLGSHIKLELACRCYAGHYFVDTSEGGSVEVNDRV
jgi:hypothetical protein